MKSIALFLAAIAVSVSAVAKLPAPSDEAKAKAAEAKAKAAHAGKVAAYQDCKAEDRAVAHYRRTAKNAKPAIATAPCVNPGAMAGAAAEKKKKKS
jgi:hypothetical protein